MQPRRIEQDPVHGKSRQRLDEAGALKKDCERTRKALLAYLRGHVYWITRYRIERHLGHCAVCRSEFEALQRMEETRQFLQYVDAPEGVAHRVREGIASLMKLKKILYRPLWLAGIAVAVAGIYYYASQPRQLDIEIENIVKTAPVTTSSLTTTPLPTTALHLKPPVVTPLVASVQRTVPQLAVSITPVNETTAIQDINEVMRGHGQLRQLKFSERDRVLSGSLTGQELLVFFDRIRGVAKVRYDRKRLDSFPAAEQIPFVLTLKAAPRTVDQSAPAQKPVPGTDKKPHEPAEAAASAPAATAPAPPEAQ